MVASILPRFPTSLSTPLFMSGKDTYLASGWFPRERQNRKIESCVRAPVLVLDADLKDWLLAQEVARELCGGDAPSSDRLKAWLYAQPREDVEALLEMARDDLLTILTRVVGQLPTVVTVSGFGHHLTYWLPEDFGFQEDSGPQWTPKDNPSQQTSREEDQRGSGIRYRGPGSFGSGNAASSGNRFFQPQERISRRGQSGGL